MARVLGFKGSGASRFQDVLGLERDIWAAAFGLVRDEVCEVFCVYKA